MQKAVLTCQATLEYKQSPKCNILELLVAGTYYILEFIDPKLINHQSFRKKVKY